MASPRSFRKRLQAGLAYAGAMALFSVVTATPAYAVSSESNESSKPSQDCWVDLDTDRSVCVDEGENLADAVLREHGVLLETEDGSFAPSALALSKFHRNGMQPLASVAIGVLYEHSNYEGAAWVVSRSGGCSVAHHEYELRPYGWNDRISSFKSFSNCRTVIYEHENLTGGSYSAINTWYVGDGMNDRASSIHWVPR